MAKHVALYRRKANNYAEHQQKCHSVARKYISFFSFFSHLLLFLCQFFFFHFTWQLFFFHFQVSFSTNFAKFTLLHCISRVVLMSNDDKNHRHLSSIKNYFHLVEEKRIKKKKGNVITKVLLRHNQRQICEWASGY